MYLVLIGIAMSLIAYPYLLIESKKYDNVLIARVATLVNLAGTTIAMVGLVLALITYLL